MKARDTGCAQATAAAKAGISERSGRRLERGTHQPHAGRPRDWRTRPDPLAAVWESELLPLLEREPQLQATTLFEHLQQTHPNQYGRSILRTLQRRVRQWKATAGPPKPVVFELEHHPGALGLSDFTLFKQAEITVRGQPFSHRLYHYRLAYSGWQYVQVVQGGESFVALSEGLQNALHACGGVPHEHRTDSLSAAYRNRGGRTRNDLTDPYCGLCQHYGLRPSRNNRRLAHENGSIEGPHGYFKNRLYQSLLLRNSCDFDSVAAYQQWVEQVVRRLNELCAERFESERPQLQPLPQYRYADYEVLGARVTTRSTIQVRCITYTVPSQLIGQRVTLHLHHDRLEVFVGCQHVTCLPRVYVPAASPTRRGRSVNYRHVAESLRRKPRAFLHCTWQQELLPDDDYRQLWQQLAHQFESYLAARLMTEALSIAARQDNERAVARYLHEQLQAGTLTLVGLQQRFALPLSTARPELTTHQHSLTHYDLLLDPDPQLHRDRRDPQELAQDAEAAAHAAPVAVPGTRGTAGELDPRTVPAGAV